MTSSIDTCEHDLIAMFAGLIYCISICDHVRLVADITTGKGRGLIVSEASGAYITAWGPWARLWAPAGVQGAAPPKAPGFCRYSTIISVVD